MRYFSRECNRRECGRNSDAGLSLEPAYTAVHRLHDRAFQDCYLKQSKRRRMGRRKQFCISFYLCSSYPFLFCLAVEQELGWVDRKGC